jgi:membrane protease subunit HflK
MRRSLLIFLVGLSLAAGAFLAAGFCVVAPGEVVVVRRLGRVLEPPWGPGLHWHYPAGIDRLDRVRTDAVRQLTVGQNGPPSAVQEPSAGEVLTGDLNLLRIEAAFQYRVADPVDHLLRADQVEELLARAAEARLARALARRGVDAVLRTDRRRIAQEVRDDLQSDADRLRLGALILGVSLTDARPPVEVAADFVEAQAAESRRDDRINVARTYEAIQHATAASRGEALREAARAYAGRTLLATRAEADRFVALLEGARRSPELARRRLYIETVQSLLERVRRKVILPPGDPIDLTLLGLGERAVPSESPQAEMPKPPSTQPRNGQ